MCLVLANLLAYFDCHCFRRILDGNDYQLFGERGK